MALKIGSALAPTPVLMTPTFMGQAAQSVAPPSEVEVLEGQTQAKPVPGLQTLQNATETELLATELLAIEAELLKHDVAALLKKKDELRKKLVATLQDAPQDAPVAVTVPAGVVTFSACEKSYTLKNREKLIEEIGLEAFLSLCKVGVTDLKKVVSENTVLMIGDYAYTNTRSMKLVPSK